MNKSSLLRPSVSVSIASAGSAGSNAGQKILVVGELGSGATATANSLVKVGFGGEGIFGATSPIAKALKAKRKDNGVEVWAYPVAEGTASAEASIEFTGVPTASGKVTFNTLGLSQTITVATTDTLTGLADKLETELNKETLFTVVKAGAKLTVTTVSKTASFNGANIFVDDKFNTGIKATIVKWATGASTAISATLLQDANIGERFQGIVVDGALGIDGVVTYTEDNFNVTNNIKDGVVFTCLTMSYANALTDANAKNKKTLVNFYNLEEMEFSEAPLSLAFEFAFKRARRLTKKEPISDLVIDATEALGGMNKASLPYFNTPMDINMGSTSELSESQLIALLEAGGTTLIYNGSVVTTEIVTTYRTNSAGSTDLSWKFLNYVDSMSVIREFFVGQIRAKYGQTRMTDGDLVAGLSMTNIGVVKAFLLSLYNLLATEGTSDQVGLTRGGTGTQTFVDSLTIEQDLSTGKYTFKAITPIVSQVRGIDGVLIESIV